MFHVPVIVAHPDTAIIDPVISHDLKKPVELLFSRGTNKVESNWDVWTAIRQLEVTRITLADNDKGRYFILFRICIQCKHLAYEYNNNHSSAHGHLPQNSFQVKNLLALPNDSQTVLCGQASHILHSTVEHIVDTLDGEIESLQQKNDLLTETHLWSLLIVIFVAEATGREFIIYVGQYS